MRLINEELFEFLFKINKLEVLKKLAVKCSSFPPFKSLLNSWQKNEPTAEYLLGKKN